MGGFSRELRVDFSSSRCIWLSLKGVKSYAKYFPIHGQQVTGVLTIAATRIIFEPNLDDPEVAKDGLMAHQFSVETGRLLEVGILYFIIYIITANCNYRINDDQRNIFGCRQISAKASKTARRASSLGYTNQFKKNQKI